MVWGIQIDVAKAQIRIQAREQPVKDFPLPGHIMATGTGNWNAATESDQLNGGWVSPDNGYILETNAWTRHGYIQRSKI
jgi:hypothetical protein